VLAAPHARIALVGDQYNHDEPAHPRIESLLPELNYFYQWVPTREITDATDLSGWDAIWVVPGAPYHAQQGVHRAIKYARLNKVPFLGTCGGFYSAVLEYAQNVLKMQETAELGDELGPIESLILPPTCVTDPDFKVALSVQAGSRLSAIYDGRTQVDEILQCNYGMVQEFLDRATQGDVRFSAWDASGAPRALEIVDHPFFVACLFQPELSSVADAVHPIVETFLNAARTRANAGMVSS
jgi:CTP synthase (UTP-ammonia lyase)